MKLFDLLVGQRRFVYLAIGLLSAAGIWSATRLPSAIYPELVFPRVTIVAQGSSLGARQVIFSIARPIEEAVSIVPGVRRVRTKAIRGALETTVDFAPNADMVTALQLVQARVNQVRADLPPGLDIEVERMTPSLFPIISYNLEGGEPATLYDLARYQIKPVISRDSGRGTGRCAGAATCARSRSWPIRPASSRAGLSYGDLADAIQQATSVAGRGPGGAELPAVSGRHRPGSAQRGGHRRRWRCRRGLRVRDVATVTMGTEDHVRVIAGDGVDRRR